VDPYRFPPFTEIGQIFPGGSETHEKGGFTELKSKTFPPWSQTPLEAGTFAVQCFGSLLLVIQSSHQCTGVCLISTKMKNMHSFFGKVHRKKVPKILSNSEKQKEPQSLQN